MERWWLRIEDTGVTTGNEDNVYEINEDESARRQIREDYEDRQDEINYCPVIIPRGKVPRLSLWKCFKIAFRIAIGR